MHSISSKKLLAVACSLAATVLALASNQGSLSAPPPLGAPPTAARDNAPTPLDPNRIEHVFLGVSAVTTLHLRTTTPIDSIALGAKVVELDVQQEADGARISMQGLALGAVTNMNVTLADATTYVFLLEIVDDRRIEYRRVFTIPGEREATDLAALAQSVRMKPADINYAGVIASIEQAAKDPIFRRTLANYKVEPIGKVYPWNNSMVHLLDGHAFMDMDLIVLRLEWANTHSKALRLSARQIGIFVANKQIDAIATKQRSALLLPGQVDTAYIFIQGQRLNVRNNWEIGLPPDAAAVRAMLGGQ